MEYVKSQREVDLTKEATMIMFDEFREAYEAAKVLNELNRRNIHKVLALLRKKDDDGRQLWWRESTPLPLRNGSEYE